MFLLLKKDKKYDFIILFFANALSTLNVGGLIWEEFEARKGLLVNKCFTYQVRWGWREQSLSLQTGPELEFKLLKLPRNEFTKHRNIKG